MQLVPAQSVYAVISPPAESQVLAFIASANNSLDVMLYQFSHSPFKTALVQAVARGVRVRLILEPKVDSNLATAEFLNARGVEVRWASQEFANTHAKTAVADGFCALVGSINWSRHAALLNREIALVACNFPAVQEIQRVFEQDWGKATPAR